MRTVCNDGRMTTGAHIPVVAAVAAGWARRVWHARSMEQATATAFDVDALRVVSEGVNRAKESTGAGIVLITHYTRILRYIKPDYVHVFVAGRVADQGGPELADELEANGYDKYVKAAAEAVTPA